MNTKANKQDLASTAQTGTARFRRAERRQIQMLCLSLDQMIPDDHTARLVWAYVEGLDLNALYAQIKAVEGLPGRDPIDPKILLALWLFATIDGINSARRLDRLCTEQFPYMWLCGGVSVNYHTLSDFRVNHVDILDDLLTQSVGVLLHQGLIELNRVAQDGMRVRASAGSSSFRRKPSLEKCLQEAKEHLEELKREAEEDGSAEDRRVKAAQERAATERIEKVQAALEERKKLVPKLERREKGSGEQARASTSDPEARKMKMGDGGYRPAYNVQFATTADSLVIIGVDVNNEGTDGGQMLPMVDQLKDRYQQQPDEYLVDSGFSNLDAVDVLETTGTSVFMPIRNAEEKRKKGLDPFAPMKGDSEEVKQCRARMETDEAKEIYKQRTATAEFPNAGCRNRGLNQFRVRGILKAKAVSLLQALTHNFQRTLNLRKLNGFSLV
jgi:transposase